VYGLVLLSERNCTTCTDKQKELWGCTSPPQSPLLLDNEPVDRCPRRPLLDETVKWNRVFWLYRQFDRGILPEEGALLSQPHKLLTYFSIIEQAKAEATDEQMKREQRRAAQKAKSGQMGQQSR
jgi:hypothetical protein